MAQRFSPPFWEVSSRRGHGTWSDFYRPSMRPRPRKIARPLLKAPGDKYSNRQFVRGSHGVGASQGQGRKRVARKKRASLGPRKRESLLPLPLPPPLCGLLTARKVTFCAGAAARTLALPRVYCSLSLPRSPLPSVKCGWELRGRQGAQGTFSRGLLLCWQLAHSHRGGPRAADVVGTWARLFRFHNERLL